MCWLAYETSLQYLSSLLVFYFDSRKFWSSEQRKFACWHSEPLFSHFVNTLSLGDRMAVSLVETSWKKLLELTYREESCAPQHYQLVNRHRLWFQNSVDLPLGHMNVRHWQMEFLIIKFPSCGSISMKISSLYIDTTTGLRYCKVKPRLHGSGQFFWNGQIPAEIPRLSFTRDPRNRASFWTASSIAICNRICTVPFKRVAQVKNSFVQNFVRTRAYGVLRSPYGLKSHYYYYYYYYYYY